MLDKVIGICRQDFQFDSFVEVMDFFKGLINLFRQMNYTEYKSEKFHALEKEIKEAIA
jgi:V/A-type H+-transporting ATPase subunit A